MSNNLSFNYGFINSSGFSENNSINKSSHNYREKYPFFNSNDKNKHKNTSEFTKNINNKILISVGAENEIFVFNDSLKIIDKMNLNNWVYNLEWKEPDNNNDNLKIIACTKNEINIIYFSKENLINNHLRLKKGTFNFLLKVKNNQYLICEKKFVSMEREGFNILNTKNCLKCFEGYYREGIKLNDNLIAFISNKVVSRGEDKLIIYDISKEIIVHEKTGYSYILSSNGLSVIENQNDKILLCACKKYIKKQKNGIFLMNLNYILNNNYKGSNYIKFIDTKDFEVHCFHQISILNENNYFNRIDLVEKTKFFFVGGFEKTKRKGNIRLYKFINYNDLKVEEIDNIIFYKFKGAINCITQLGSNKFIISCWDGNIFSFEFSLLDSYLFDKKIENKNFKFSSKKP